MKNCFQHTSYFKLLKFDRIYVIRSKTIINFLFLTFSMCLIETLFSYSISESSFFLNSILYYSSCISHFFFTNFHFDCCRCTLSHFRVTLNAPPTQKNTDLKTFLLNSSIRFNLFYKHCLHNLTCMLYVFIIV